MKTFTLSNGLEIKEGDRYKEEYIAGYSIYEVCFGDYDNGEDYEDHRNGIGFYLMEYYFHKKGEEGIKIQEIYYNDLIYGEKYEETVNPDLPPPPPPENPNGRE